MKTFDHTLCIQELLISEAQCSNCTSWMMEAAEVKTPAEVTFWKYWNSNTPIPESQRPRFFQGAGDKHCELPGGWFLETQSRSRLEGSLSKNFNPYLRKLKALKQFIFLRTTCFLTWPVGSGVVRSQWALSSTTRGWSLSGLWALLIVLSTVFHLY